MLVENSENFLGMEIHWEHVWFGIHKIRVDSVLMNPDLLALAVLENWGGLLDVSSEALVGSFVFQVNKSIKVENQTVSISFNGWGSCRGEVEAGRVVVTKWNLEVCWSSAVELCVKVLDDVSEIFHCCWHYVRSDHSVNDGSTELYELLQVWIFHHKLDFLEVKLV